MDSEKYEMTIETLKQKIENQSKVIKELTNENEVLYHQYNHLIIRNGKMLKRVDDLQKIIDDLHIRIEELQLINGNMMQLNDKLRKRTDFSGLTETAPISAKSDAEEQGKIESEFEVDLLLNRWKNYPGQIAQNGPNLRKQVVMLLNLYTTSSLRASELFNRTGVGGVTGARYVSTLKKFGFIRYTGARKKGCYEITRKGMDFIEQVPNDSTKPAAEVFRESSEPVKSEIKSEMAFNDRNDL